MPNGKTYFFVSFQRLRSRKAWTNAVERGWRTSPIDTELIALLVTGAYNFITDKTDANSMDGFLWIGRRICNGCQSTGTSAFLRKRTLSISSRRWYSRVISHWRSDWLWLITGKLMSFARLCCKNLKDNRYLNGYQCMVNRDIYGRSKKIDIGIDMVEIWILSAD